MFGTTNLYGRVELYIGRFNDAYRDNGRDYSETIDSDDLRATFQAMLDDWTNAGYDPFTAPQETAQPFGRKSGRNPEALGRVRVTAKRMVGLPDDAPLRTDESGYPVHRMFADVEQDEPEVEIEPGFENEVQSFNLFAYLSRSDVTWNPSVCSVVKDSLFCPTSEEFIPASGARQRPGGVVHPALGRDRLGGEGQAFGRPPRRGDHEGGRRRLHAGRHPAPGLLAQALDAVGVGERLARDPRDDRQGRGADRARALLAARHPLPTRPRPFAPCHARRMTEIVPLADAVSSLIHDGDTVAMEGFTHLIPHAAGHAVIRAGLKDLTAVRMTPDLIYDQLIGMGCVKRLVFSWGGNPGVGSLHRFRDAVEKGWPRPLEIEERSHADLANAYVAGASGLPFSVIRGYVGSDLPVHNPIIKFITCPFTGEKLAASPAICPDIAMIHAQQADRKGNVMLWGISGVQKEVALASRQVLVTVEEIVDELEPRPGGVYLPHWVVTARSRQRPAAPGRPTRSATTSGTTRSTRTGTGSRATGCASPPGWSAMCSAPRISQATSGAWRLRRLPRTLARRR